jgi:C-terminal processing protease CtpA/Prc
VDEGTASAAELLAAALQDHHRATIVGTKTFGQGFVYSVRPLEDGWALLVASGTLQRPNGRSLNAGGVTPDVAVDFPDDSVVRGTADDPQLAKALSILPDGKSTGQWSPNICRSLVSTLM